MKTHYFHIEMFGADKSAVLAMVRAKTYEEACVRLAKIHGEPNAFKLLGQYEQSEVDKEVLRRFA